LVFLARARFYPPEEHPFLDLPSLSLTPRRSLNIYEIIQFGAAIYQNTVSVSGLPLFLLLYVTQLVTTVQTFSAWSPLRASRPATSFLVSHRLHNPHTARQAITAQTQLRSLTFLFLCPARCGRFPQRFPGRVIIHPVSPLPSSLRCGISMSLRLHPFLGTLFRDFHLGPPPDVDAVLSC